MWAYPRLPERIPVHFGLSGTPDRWAETGFGSWFGPVVLTVVMVLFLEALASWVERRPHGISTPDPRRFAALPEEARKEVAAEGGTVVRWVNVLVVVLFGAVQWSVWAAARSGEGNVATLVLVLLAAMIVAPVLAIWGMLRSQRLIERLHAAHTSGAQASGAHTSGAQASGGSGERSEG